jgi:hypothetical protein
MTRQTDEARCPRECLGCALISWLPAAESCNCPVPEAFDCHDAALQIPDLVRHVLMRHRTHYSPREKASAIAAMLCRMAFIFIGPLDFAEGCDL